MRDSSLKMTIEDLFEQYGALAHERQGRLAELIGEHGWQFDMDRGTIAFGPLRTPVQILGTVSDLSNTWLWSWANEQSDIPPTLLQAAETLRSIGEEKGVAELNEPQFDVQPFAQGHRLAMIAVGLLDAPAYYRGPYDGGAAFFLLPELNVPIDRRPRSLQVLSTFMSFIELHECGHRTALESYLRLKGFVIKAESNRHLVAESSGDSPIEARFNSSGQLVKLEAKISAAAKPRWKFW